MYQSNLLEAQKLLNDFLPKQENITARKEITLMILMIILIQHHYFRLIYGID